MGQQCLQKASSSLLSTFSLVNGMSSTLYSAVLGGKSEKQAKPTHDYERDILLDEDIDDYNAFDYEDQEVVQLILRGDYRNIQKSATPTPPKQAVIGHVGKEYTGGRIPQLNQQTTQGGQSIAEQEDTDELMKELHCVLDEEEEI